MKSMKRLVKVVVSFLLLAVMIACNKLKETTTVKNTAEEYTLFKKPVGFEKDATLEDFTSFYYRFHSDSLFQISRIIFPVKGYTMDSSVNNIKWNRQNWIMHKADLASVDTSLYKVELQQTEGSRHEKIYIEGGGFNSERAFKRINGRWYLTKFINEEM